LLFLRVGLEEVVYPGDAVNQGYTEVWLVFDQLCCHAGQLQQMVPGLCVFALRQDCCACLSH
jgi:hypothetical protein